MTIALVILGAVMSIVAGLGAAYTGMALAQTITGVKDLVRGLPAGRLWIRP
jgi:hypothetical protein